MSSFEEILVPVDNSKYSDYCIDVGITIAKMFKSKLVGNHVYAAKLHDERFVQMEGNLPPEYQTPEELTRQRDIHDSLITKGLQLISDSFLDYFSDACIKADVPFSRKMMEGKNYYQIVKDIEASDYSMVLMGAYGLGALHKTALGSVTSRVVRRSKVNVLVVRVPDIFKKKIVVCVDGSAKSFSAVKTSAILAKRFGVPLEAISVYDPNFHVTAFRSIAGVLSEEAGKIFRFQEQEKLHDEIIDKGLEKIYQGHLDSAVSVAAKYGVKMKSTLKAGRAIEEIIEYVDGEETSLVVVGRTGIHSDNGLDIGSISENLLINLKCNLLVVNEQYHVPFDGTDNATNKAANIQWSPEALDRISRVPDFVRNMVKKAIVDYAFSIDCKEITGEVVTEARKKMGM